MLRRLVISFFVSNWFLGFLAIVLSVETSLQLNLPLNTSWWYIFLFTIVVTYYTYAYQSAEKETQLPTPRTYWYKKHKRPIAKLQAVLVSLSIVSSAIFLYNYHKNIPGLPFPAWLLIILTLLAGLSYYDKFPFFNARLNGWTKPFTIGFCWAAAVTFFPLIAYQLETGSSLPSSYLLSTWLFIKNWMFCSVNAILFDIKDYEDDTNQSLKTFVVRYGVHFTIFSILLPMMLLGVLSFLFFATYRGFNFLQIGVNSIPFLLTLSIGFALEKERPILFYLIVIDGLLLVKALCGIVAVTKLASL